MLIDCIADTHGHYPQLEGGDLLIVAGDLTRSDEGYQYEFLYDILKEKNYKRIIIIAGNHDNALQNGKVEFVEDSKIKYLCDSGTEFEYWDCPTETEARNCPHGLHSVKRALKIWGSPWTKTFPGINPKCKAFTVDTDEELAEKWAMIPDDTDILITHCPPYGYFDYVYDDKNCGSYPVGSKSLVEAINRVMPKLCIFGHVHEGGGSMTQLSDWYGGRGPIILVNASHVNEYYEPVNKPIRIEL